MSAINNGSAFAPEAYNLSFEQEVQPGYNPTILDRGASTNLSRNVDAANLTTASENVRFLTDQKTQKRYDVFAGIAPRGDHELMHFTRFRKDDLPELRDRRLRDSEQLYSHILGHKTQPDVTRLPIEFSRLAPRPQTEVAGRAPSAFSTNKAIAAAAALLN